MKIKTLKILRAILAAIGFFAFFFLVIVCGSDDTGIILPYGLVGACLFAVGVLGGQAVHNEIEYIEKNEQRAVKRCGR